MGSQLDEVALVLAVQAKILTITVLVGHWSQHAMAEEDDDDHLFSERESFADFSVFDVRDHPSRPRNETLVPLVSFFLPGFDQWYEGQYGSALIYSGIALGGLGYASFIANNNVKETEAEDADDEEEDETELDAKDNVTRKVMLGSLLYQGSGGFSSYHAFRSAVRTQKRLGKYSFLKYEETPVDILAAPLNFSYLARSTTWGCLGVGAALAVLVQAADPPEDYERAKLTSSDLFFSTAFSWNAGTHEEAVFRGYLHPVFFEYTGSSLLSNAASSTLFALAHLPTNPTPIAQLILGSYWAYVTELRQWRIGEAVFMHTWWDVLAFTSIYSFQKKNPDVKGLRATLWLPPVYFLF